MRVVVTRPKDRAQATAARLLAMGHEPVLLPLSVARHLTEAAKRGLSHSYPAIAITSAEALRAVDIADLAPHLATPLFAVGKKTAQAARDVGFANIRIAAGDGASLAELIARAAPAQLLYLTGRPRSSTLEAALSERAIRHTVTECYEMVALEPQRDEIAALLQPTPGAILFHSRETARLFFQLPAIEPAIENDPIGFVPRIIACLSARVADIVPPILRDRIRVAEKPDEASLLALL